MEDDSQTSRHDDSQTLQRGKAPCKVSQGEELAGKSLGCHLPKQDERPGRCRRKRWPADPRPGLPLESLQYSELGAMRVPTTGKPAQETDTGVPIRTSPEDAACTSPPTPPPAAWHWGWQLQLLLLYIKRPGQRHAVLGRLVASVAPGRLTASAIRGGEVDINNQQQLIQNSGRLRKILAFPSSWKRTSRYPLSLVTQPRGGQQGPQA